MMKRTITGNKDYQTVVSWAIATIGTLTLAEEGYVFEGVGHPQQGADRAPLQWGWSKHQGIFHDALSMPQEIISVSSALYSMMPAGVRRVPILLNSQNLSAEVCDRLEMRGIQAVLLVPLTIQQQWWGVLELYYRHPVKDNANHLQVASNVMAMAVSEMVDHYVMTLDLLRHNRLLEGVTWATNLLLTQLDNDAGTRQALKALGYAIRVSRVYVFECSSVNSRKLFENSAYWEWLADGISSQSSDSVILHLANLPELRPWWELLSKNEVVEGLTQRFPSTIRVLLEKQSIQSILLIPILLEGQLWGILGFDDCVQERYWSESEKLILRTVASSLSGAIARRRAEADLESLAVQLEDRVAERTGELEAINQLLRHNLHHDNLTGLANRVQLLEQLREVIAHPTPRYALLFLDLDHFKLVNDQLGHLAGDRLLIAIAHRLSQYLGNQHLVARLGGDEFILLLRNIDPATEAPRIAQQVWATLLYPFYLNGQEIFITASIGIALGSEHYKHPEDAIRDADNALRHARQKGGSRYEVFDPAVKPDAVTPVAERKVPLIHRHHITSSHSTSTFKSPAKPLLESGTASVPKPVESVVRAQNRSGSSSAGRRFSLWLSRSYLMLFGLGLLSPVCGVATAQFHRNSAIQQVAIAQTQVNVLSDLQTHLTEVQLYGVQQLYPIVSTTLELGAPDLGIEPTQTEIRLQTYAARSEALQERLEGFLTDYPTGVGLYPDALQRISETYGQTLHTYLRSLQAMRSSLPSMQPYSIQHDLETDFLADHPEIRAEFLVPQLQQLHQSLNPLLQQAEREQQRALYELEMALALEYRVLKISLFVSVAIAAGVIWRAVCTVAQPLEQITQTAQRAIQDPDRLLQISVPTTSSFEALAVALNQLIQQKVQQVQHLKQMSQDLEGRVAVRTAELQTANALLQQSIYYDALTGLPNRALLLEHLRELMAEEKSHPHFAVLFLDLDRFKVINDSRGHLFGDRLLIAIAHRLTNCLTGESIVARMGGDEFVVLLPKIDHPNTVTAIAEHVCNSLTRPFYIDSQEILTTASIGIALSSSTYQQPEELLRDADIIMYRAKAKGRARYEVFDTQTHRHIVNQLHLENDLQRAVNALEGNPFSTTAMRNQFLLHYQPIIELNSLKIEGFEALVRWEHPDLGLVAPNEFIPLAEETGLIVPLSRWILFAACQQLKHWQEQFPTLPPLRMAVNFSGHQFPRHHIVADIDTVLQETGINGNQIKLEITESALIDSAEVAKTILGELKQRQICLCIDDFGTGYSSLSYLHQFPLDTLKIDRTFVQSIDNRGDRGEIVRTIVTLAHAMSMDVIAEGIETPAQLQFLRELGCTLGQGYLFAKAVNVPTIETLLKKQIEQGLPFSSDRISDLRLVP